uniref:catechol O-methyltransferase n=1 Tax=Alexandrium monilatum TaxID=311494 RepID=A0A7S4UQX4_9DINO
MAWGRLGTCTSPAALVRAAGRRWCRRASGSNLRGRIWSDGGSGGGRGCGTGRGAGAAKRAQLEEARLGAALAACARSAAWQRALDVLFASAPVDAGSGGAEPNTLCFGAAMSACGHGLAWEAALELLPRALRAPAPLPPQRAPPSAGPGGGAATSAVAAAADAAARGRSACRVAAMRACEVAHQWEQAVALLVCTLASSDARPHPDAAAFAVVISACDRGEAWRAALEVFVAAKAHDAAGALATRLALKACARSRSWEAALALLAEASLLEASQAEEAEARAARVTAVSACDRARQWEAVLACVDTLRNADAQLGAAAQRCAIRAVGSARLWQGALQLLEEARETEQVDAWCLSAAAWACEAAGRRAVAAYLLAEELRVKSALAVAPKELRLLEYIRRLAPRGDADATLRTIERFARERRWLKIAGGKKGRPLLSSVQRGDRIVELGAYVGYSALRLALKLQALEEEEEALALARTPEALVRSPRGKPPRVVAIEGQPLMAAVARAIVSHAGAEAAVEIRTGRAADWLAAPGGLGPIDLLVLDHRGAAYHEDLAAAEPNLRTGARVVADNVLHPGAPLFLAHIFGLGQPSLQQRYRTRLYAVEEFEHRGLDDWVAVCRWVGKDRRSPSPRNPPCPAPPELRRWAAEIERLCRLSSSGPVDWVGFQARFQPALTRMLSPHVVPTPSRHKQTLPSGVSSVAEGRVCSTSS